MESLFHNISLYNGNFQKLNEKIIYCNNDTRHNDYELLSLYTEHHTFTGNLKFYSEYQVEKRNGKLCKLIKRVCLC